MKITDEQIMDVCNSMENGMNGFLKQWGLLQFGRAVLRLAGAPVVEAAPKWININMEQPKDADLCWIAILTVCQNAPAQYSVALARYSDNFGFCDLYSSNSFRRPTHWIKIERPTFPAAPAPGASK